MILNLYMNGSKYLLDTREIPDGRTFSIEPTTNQEIGQELYPRIVNQVQTKDQIDIRVKVPTGLSARFSPMGDQYYIEPILKRL